MDPVTPRLMPNNKEKVSYVVDKETGPYFTIQSAIDAADFGGLIQINRGLYIENLRIKNKSLTIEAKDVDSEVYIMGFSGPTVLVELQPSQRATL